MPPLLMLIKAATPISKPSAKSGTFHFVIALSVIALRTTHPLVLA